MENNRKSLYELSLKITEPEYRQIPVLSQSSIATYEKEGFECLDKLFEPFETPSLTFGSAVDCLITDGEEAFSERFFVSDMPKISAAAEPIVKEIYAQFHNSYTNINDIPDDSLMPILTQNGWKGNTNWGSKAKCDAIRKDGAQYYQTMFMAGDKKILSQDVYNGVFACVRALKDSPQTAKYFCPNDPFSDIERFYQLKFEEHLGGHLYKGMLDLVIVNHKEKIIIPCDLKTSHNKEYNFPKSFIQFRYDIQSRLYWRLLRTALDRDEYFKDFKLLDFRFIVVNNNSNPMPLVWKFDKTQAVGEIEIGKIRLRDPETIGNELYNYLEKKPEVPMNIHIEGTNSIDKWLDMNSD